MLAERYLKRRYVEGRAEGKAGGYEQVRNWLRRRDEAEAKGEKFTEPPPYEKN